MELGQTIGRSQSADLFFIRIAPIAVQILRFEAFDLDLSVTRPSKPHNCKYVAERPVNEPITDYIRSRYRRQQERKRDGNGVYCEPGYMFPISPGQIIIPRPDGGLRQVFLRMMKLYTCGPPQSPHKNLVQFSPFLQPPPAPPHPQ